MEYKLTFQAVLLGFFIFAAGAPALYFIIGFFRKGDDTFLSPGPLKISPAVKHEDRSSFDKPRAAGASGQPAGAGVTLKTASQMLSEAVKEPVPVAESKHFLEAKPETEKARAGSDPVVKIEERTSVTEPSVISPAVPGVETPAEQTAPDSEEDSGERGIKDTALEGLLSKGVKVLKEETTEEENNKSPE